MATITNADREAAQALCASGWTHAIEAFARHRELGIEQGKAIGRREALEEAAKVAENAHWADGWGWTPLNIAKSIRALIGETR